MNQIVRDAPAVSVLVPSFRAGRYLVQLCESLVAQSFQNFEVLILSDGGDDHLQPGMQVFMGDPRFRIEAWESNRGVAAATAHLLGKARGAFWCYPGADDLLHPEFLAARMETAARVSEANVIFGPGIQIDEAGAEIWYHPLRVVAERLASFDGRRIEPRLMLRLLLQENVINTPSVFCRSDTTVPILLHANVDWRYAQDYHYWILLAAAGGGFCYDARVLHSYRMHQDQMSRARAMEGVRLAEFRLVPLVALAAAARLSTVGAECWREWREDLYVIWTARAASLLRRGKLRWKWQQRAASAYQGRTVGTAAALVDFVRMMPRSVALHREEARRAAGQVWVNGLRKIDEPLFRAAMSVGPSCSPSGVVLAHPTGNQFFRHLALALRDAGVLAEACTTIDWRGDGLFAKLLPHRIAAELGRRSFSNELGVPVRQHPGREWLRLAAERLGLSALTRHEIGPLSIDAVYRDFDYWMARRLDRARGAGVVYAYEDAAEATFLAAAKLGWTCVYDLPIAYWETSRRLLQEEAARWPEWEPTLVGTRDSEEKCARKTRELERAEVVICPSRFVAESLPGALRAARRIVVAPFGSPASGERRTSPPGGAPLRVLFAGSMSQRKGLADLFAAVRLLERRDVELVVLGSPVASLQFYRERGPAFVHERPRPHAAVLALMRTCDVLCLPSIVEGRALVVQEAMSQGLPAIVTANTGTDDVVEDGRSGFVVPIRSPAAIAEKIAWFAEHRAAVAEMGEAARRAAERFTWAAYGAQILEALSAVSPLASRRN